MGDAALQIHAMLFSMVLCGGLFYDIYYANFEGDTVWNYRGFAGKFKFLTFINMWLQSGYWCLALAAGLSAWISRDLQMRLRALVDTIHASLAFPVGIFVCVMFWMIYAVDRELVYPKYLDEIIPSWLNHVMHTIHIPFLLLDKRLVQHRYPKQSEGMTILLIFAVMYQVWILYLAFGHDVWVYPILAVMNWTYRIIFFVLNWMFMLMLYKTGDIVTQKMWGGSTGRPKVR